MTKFLPKFLAALLILLTITVSSSSSAYAVSKKHRYNRITVGTVEVRDWHHDIVKSYPNLSHYHWNPMYSNVQGMTRVSPPRHSVRGINRPAKKRKPKKMVKRKIAPQYVHYSSVNPRPRHIYKKPRHMAPSAPKNAQRTKANLYTHQKLPKRVVSVNMRRKAVNPHIIYRRTNLNYSRAVHPKKAIASKLNSKQTAIDLKNKNTDIKLKSKSTDIKLRTKSTGVKLATRRTDAKLKAETANAKLAHSQSLKRKPVVKSYKPYSSYVRQDGSLVKTKVSGRVSH